MKRKLLLNTVMSLLLQVVTVIAGFILPKQILAFYGFSINGLIQSIAQFLYIISFMELGVGQVIQTTLYKPLSNGDMNTVSKVIKSGNLFFRKIANVLVIYILGLCLLSPYIFGCEFEIKFVVTLILVMGIGSFSQYYFGLIDKILLNADQRGYIQYTIQILTTIINVIVVSLLIFSGKSIQLVKLVSALTFLLASVLIRQYINKKYKINRLIIYHDEPIKQKWNGIAQHLSQVVLEGTDIIILTLFATLSDVSVYSVYYMVISGIRQLYIAFTSGIQSMIGSLWAKNDVNNLNTIFQAVETILHFVVVFLFTCIAILIVPFIRVYTLGISDYNYIQPLFALIMTFAYAIRCLRTPYHILILAGGHYKQTQKCHINTALINVFVSVIVVSFYGLIGIAVGTFLAFLYQTIWMMYYNSKNLLYWNAKKIIKQLFVDVLAVLLIFISTYWITIVEISYFGWIKMAFIVALISLLEIGIIGYIFYGKDLKKVVNVIR